MNVSAIIMAAGLSVRMNQNKLKMKIKDRFIYEYIFETIKKSRCFHEVIVVANDEDVLEKAREFGFKSIKNEMSFLGQSESIKLGVEHANNTEGYMFFTADQPFISIVTIKKLLLTFKKHPNNIIFPCYNGINGSPTIFPTKFKNQLLNLNGDTGGKFIIINNTDKIIKESVDSDVEHMDIDTIEDYEKACKKVGD